MLNTNEIIGWSREEMAKKVALDIPDGSYVNLGIGIPELVADFVPENREVIYQTENGLLGMGGVPEKKMEDRELVNAGKKCITAIPGASFFHHADSFAMVRGGHLDMAILGAFQVAQNGDLANWRLGNKGVPAVGGAMDLVHGAKQVVVITDHIAKDGSPKLVEECTYPLTGIGCITRIYTSLAVIDISDKKFVLREKLPTLSLDKLQSLTGAELHFEGAPDDLKAPKLGH